MQAAVMEESQINNNNNNNNDNNIDINATTAVPIRTYEDLFPALKASKPQNHINNASTSKMRVESSTVSKTFVVPFEERKIDTEKFGEGESQRICKSIMKETGALIEITIGKDQSITFSIRGRQTEVQDAFRLISMNYKTQTVKQINVPKEHHGLILGKRGERLKEIEKQTATKINVPSISEESDIITISGPKEGVEKAEHEIRTMSDEQSKKAYERVHVPKIYHPFISGPFTENVTALSTQTGARINVPPPTVMQDEITIIGEKDGVSKAKATIESIYRDMEKKCSTVCVEVPKAQHKYVFGQRGSTIQEILKETGVSVEIPSSDTKSDTITLRGPQDKLGSALSMVYEKANSKRSTIIEAPAWIHKYIIGRKGININKITGDSKVLVDFAEKTNIITLEGPHEQLELVEATIATIVKDYETRYTFVDMQVNRNHAKHIIGKAGANINRLKDELEVDINIEDVAGVNKIHIEGPIEGVRRAHKEIKEKVEKLDNEKEKDVIIDYRLHSTLIGPKGESIRELRTKYPLVNILIPNSSEKNDVVKLRGPKDEVDKCHKQLMKLVKDAQESSFVMEVPIFKKFHKFIIGKGGANIKKIRDDTQTKIELPAEGDKNEVIVISGRKENVNDARERILKIQSELADVVTEELTIPPKYYNSIIGAGGKLISAIIEECGNVSIKFPTTESNSDKVVIRGPKEDVEKAKLQLIELSNERQLSSFTAEVRAKPQHHKFLIGKNGASIKEIRDQTGARIIFPGNNDEDKEVITIIGKEENVLAAKAQLEAIIKNNDNITEGEVLVDPKHHKHFVARRGEVLRRISDDYGGVLISFPRQGTDSHHVSLKGSKECVELAKKRILEIVHDLESQVTIDCVIPQKHHRVVMGPRGSKVQQITYEHDVHIKFPDRNATDESNETNGDSAELNCEAVRQCDIIRISGTEERCEAAKAALLELVPVTEEVNVPFDIHRWIIGQKGHDVRALMNRYDVHIELSPPEEKLDIIKITGAPNSIAEAKKAIDERVEEYEENRKDRELRSFELKLEIDPIWHSKIIGRKGAVINKIRANHGVQISFPRKEDDVDNIITIQGYEAAANAAKDEIMKIYNELNELVREVIQVDSRIHARLIGQRGRSIHKIMDEYKVEIKFPKQGENPDDITIIGTPDAVSEAKDHILNLQEEYMEDIIDNVPTHTNDFSTALETAMQKGPEKSKDGFVVQGAPWTRKGNKNAPNTQSQEDFPRFGGLAQNAGANVTSDTPLSSVWGQPR